MRLKNPQDISISVHNGNENLLTSDHNTISYTNNTTNTLTLHADTINTNTNSQTYNATNGEINQDTLQWCNTINTIQHQQNSNKPQSYPPSVPKQLSLNQLPKPAHRPLYNINNNLATSLRVPPHVRRGTASSICSESSPDDSLLDYEDAQQSCSSIDTTPQDEDRGFDLSDSESLSDDGNLSGENTRTRGIVNPNYPGFQHLAHTLDYSIKACSDTDFTDDDLDLDPVNIKNDANNINNNNNNNEDDLEYKIDSVNRLDSVENIQKVFYDKPKLNIPLEPLERDPEKRNNCLDEEASSSNTDEDLEGNILQDISDPESNTDDQKCNIIGDFGKELSEELGKIVERGVEQDLEEAVEKLSLGDLSPSALKYNIEPNTEQPFEKACSVKIETIQLLEPVTVQQKVEQYLGTVEKTNFDTPIYEPISEAKNYNLSSKLPHKDNGNTTGLYESKLDAKICANFNCPEIIEPESKPTRKECIKDIFQPIISKIDAQINPNDTIEAKISANIKNLEDVSGPKEVVEPLIIKSDVKKNPIKKLEPETEDKPRESCSRDILDALIAQLDANTNPKIIDKPIENSLPEIFEPIITKTEAKSQPNPTHYEEIDLTNKKLNTIILEPVNIALEVPQYAETVNLKSDDENLDTPAKDETKIVDATIEANLQKNIPNDIKNKTTDALLSDAQEVIRNIEKDFQKMEAKLETMIPKIEIHDANKNHVSVVQNGNTHTKNDHSGSKKFNSNLQKEESSSKSLDASGNRDTSSNNRSPNSNDSQKPNQNKPNELFCKENKTKDENEKDEDSLAAKKKIEPTYVKKRRNSNSMMGSLITVPRRELGGRNKENVANRRSLPAAREKKRTSPEILGGFDVYNIETAMPKIDLDAIESHLKAAREEERRRRTDREEIRRRLAMGSEDDYYSGNDRPGRKPSLQARLQSGMNLQICFMNETASDTDSPTSDSEYPVHKSTPPPLPTKSHKQSAKQPSSQRPVSLPLGNPPALLQPITQPMTEADFFARQARLQTEARMALAQAKEMAHMQMEIERQRQKKSPITEMVRSSLEKVGIPFPEERRRVSRQILTEMNVAQLQVIVNDLHTQIETLNESLVRYLMNRDDLHMEQDSMLVDIEDLTRYLGAKEQTLKEQKPQNNNIPPPSPAPASPLISINNTVKPRLHRIASLVKK